MNYPHGMHDREGRDIVPSGGWCLDTVSLTDGAKSTDYSDLRSDIRWLVRVNWGYGSRGTYPQPSQMYSYVEAAVEFMRGCQGVWGFILGNEPNHEQERPGGYMLTPVYTSTLVAATIESARGKGIQSRIIPPAIAPYHASPVDWLYYFKTMWELLERSCPANGPKSPAAVNIHAYTRSADPNEISSSAKMAAPLLGQHSGFRTYQDALSKVPASFKHLPALITEFNELREDGWLDQNTGVVRATYDEIGAWNGVDGNQQVESVVLYRWPRYDKWYIEGKSGVQEDFKMAVDQWKEPVDGTDGLDNDVYLPAVGTGTANEQPEVKRQIDQEAIDYGVTLEPLPEMPEEGEFYWIAQIIEFLNPDESEGRHHFYFDTVDESDNRLVDVKILVQWPTDEKIITSEPKPGERYSANFPFSPGKNAFSATVLSNRLSETVEGAGMGYDTPSGFNPGEHTSVFVKWVRKVAQKRVVPVTPVNRPSSLIHPVANEIYRRVTQPFGVNGSYYSQFKVDGVPLKGHNGVDFGTPVNTPIVAADEGVVIEQFNDINGYGKYIKLKHHWGETLYAHLDDYMVKVGDKVHPGQIVGLSGNTGNSTGPHLHFGMRLNPYNRQDGWGGYIDPLPFVEDTVAPEKPYQGVPVEMLLRDAAREFGVPWQLAVSLGWAESSFNPKANSGVAKGLLQITKPTWDEWAPKVGAKDVDNPRDNARVGLAYLRFLLQYYKGNVYKALWAYNVGPGNVNNGNVPAETKEFANKVLHGSDLLTAMEVD